MTHEEAIKAISIHKAYMREYEAPKTKDALDMAIAALREQESAENAHCNCCKKGNSWISVEERLPEDDLPPDTDRVAIKVLTVTKHGTRRFVRELTRQRWEWRGVMQPWSWSKDARGVTHWMPLPEPEVEG